MRLRKLILRNFGPYRGEQVVELTPRIVRGRERPIVLVGGRNGAGKTHILEAVELCLYGRLALGPRVGEGEYHAYLRDKIHRGRGILIPIYHASVALEFDYAHAGRRFVYFIQRAWDGNAAGTITERLRILRDSEPLSEVESEFWPEFVRSLVPPGVLHLFFFDGEKIKRLAEEETQAGSLAESVKGLLGLDLVEQLQADLDLYVSRQLKKTVTVSTAARLSEIELQEREAIGQLEKVRAEEIAHSERLTSLTAEIEEAERQLADKGEGFAAKRGELRQRVADLTERHLSIERRLREACEGTLPFGFCPRIAKAVIEQLDRESDQQRLLAAHAEVANAMSVVWQHLTADEFTSRVKWNADAQSTLHEELELVKKELAERFERKDTRPAIHALSERQSAQVRRVLSNAIGPTTESVVASSRELIALETELRSLRAQMNRAPEEDEMTPMVSRFSELQQQHGSASLELALTAEKLKSLERELIELRRERARIEKTEAGAASLASRVSLARRARETLDDYLIRLTRTKTEQLESVALECFRRLCQKPDLVQSLKIDPSTFRVTLFDEREREIPKESLSAGEKQIYAISLLWALARVSGRPLPMIIDTPLGRLDSQHRLALLENYFPFASHQVIVLSTDTEVDRANVELLKPYISHCVSLVTHEGSTDIAAGYFWEGANSGGAAIKEDSVLEAG
jgi:DNA sulfur modification protein DndD